MFFKKWWTKFSFFRRIEIKKLRKKLNTVIENFDSGFYNDSFIIILHSILKSPVIRFNEKLITNLYKDISLYTNSSAMALKSLEKKEIRKSNLEKSKLLKIEPEERTFSYWYSNQESVELFIEQMTIWIGLYIANLSPGETTILGVESKEPLSEEVVEFLESLLFRILISDTATILDFYLESDYDRL